MNIKQLSKGVHGTVYKVTNDGRTFAFKVFTHESEEEEMHSLIYKTVNCKRFIVKPLQIDENLKKTILRRKRKKYGYAMEYVDGIALHEFLKDSEVTDKIQIREQIQRVFKCMWSHGFIHGDAHTDNIIVQYKNQKPVIKVFDFGYSAIFAKPKKSEDLLSWFLKHWKSVLKQHRVKKSNPNSMYFDPSLVEVFAKGDVKVVKKLLKLRPASIKKS